MRIILSVFIVMFHFLLLNVQAEEIIVGRVVSLDRANEKITVVISSGLEEDGNSLKNSDQSDNSSTLPLITVFTANSNFPCWVEPGSLVRIWGDFDRGSGIIKAKSLSRAKLRSGSSDDTGVRRRLRRGRKHKHGRSKHHGGH
ncbi:MAG: hypothetical protein JRJ00_13590 [Deltaproteobacteria bacterium]|nr:hypothetical protein [Deltaproteobacteria bacterium]